MGESFLLAWRSLIRGHVLTLLLATTGLVHLLAPALVRSDGTADGWREMFVRAVPGSVYVVTCVALLACACGFFAQERETNRLAQTVVRPVSAFAVAMGRFVALATVGALVLTLNSALLLARGGWTDCRHVIAPDLPPLSVVARAALEEYLNDPQTPEEVKKAPRHALLSLLANKEIDRYDTISAGKSMSWPFRPSDLTVAKRSGQAFNVRVRFATRFDLRSAVSGRFELDGWGGTVSNCTQSIIEVPISVRDAEAASSPQAEGHLVFRNDGQTTVMLRPRRDLEILAAADSFGLNLMRATLEMFSVLTFLCAFGLFLSSALSRPVALFSAFVALFVVVMSPNVVSQFPDGLDVAMVDRIGLEISRAVSTAMRCFLGASPVSDLATGTCIEWKRLLWSVLANMLVAPCVLLSLSAVIVRRRPLS